jgi:hypothetical protein
MNAAHAYAIKAAVRVARGNHRDWFMCAIVRRDPNSPQAACARAARDNALWAARQIKAIVEKEPQA